MADPWQVVSFALETIGKLLVDEGRFLAGVEDHVKLLQGELRLMQASLREAERKNIENEVVRVWISDAKDIAYDVEDLAEKYAFRFGSSGDGGPVMFFNSCAPLFTGCYDRHNIGLEIQPLNTRISILKQHFFDHGIQGRMEEEGSSTVQQQLRRTYSFVGEDDFVGLQSDVDMLVEHLVIKDARVVSITGMGGLGKTTIAKKVYNHPAVKRHFYGSVWICVSQQWQTYDILQRILIKLLPEKEEDIKAKWSDDQLLRNLLQVQQEKRCLIVLDDIWTADVWDCIKPAFPTGSKILVTTRNKDVAVCIGPDGFHHEPRLLDDDECWELLRRKSRPERHQEGHQHMNEFKILGKEMVKHCGGLPLAVIVLGGILLTKTTPSEWEMWKGKIVENGEVKRILDLSYYDLPYRLKSCFLYLVLFPEDADIDANTIYQLWMAEGMVSNQGVGNESMMDLAEQYMVELGQRSMVQLQTLNIPGMRRRFKSCRLHDLMREFCLLQVKREGFLTCVDHVQGNDPFSSLSATLSSKHRRLVINVAQEDDTPRYTLDTDITKFLRMYQFNVSNFYGYSLAKNSAILCQLSSFEMLRVFRMEGWRARAKKLPKAIGKLLHLRYLSLRDSYFSKLPSSMENLQNLQTLDLRLYNGVSRLPNIHLNMERLICLYLPCIVKLEHKVRLDGLNRLEILYGFDDKVCVTKDLLKLPNLRVLGGKFRSLENLGAVADFVHSNSGLEHASITTSCDLSIEREKGVAGLRHLLVGRSIHSWKSIGPMWKFPEYEDGMASCVVRLQIFDSDLDIDEMCRTIEQFPHLARLTICVSRGQVLVFSSQGFPKLEKLTLSWADELEKWVIEEGAVPNLHELELRDCPALASLPDGICSVKNLKHLTFQGMSKEFDEKLRMPDGEDVHKISHVPFVNVFY